MKKLLLLSVSIAFSILLLEILLRSFTPFPINTQSNKMPHPELGYVLDPAMPEIAESGFRNNRNPGPHDISAIGDSHTYGINVAWDRAWPYQLKDIIDEKGLAVDVYNFGVSSYNIYHYFRLFEIASQYNPKHIVIGLFPANDLILGACEVLKLDYWKQRIADLGISDTQCRGGARAGSTPPAGPTENRRSRDVDGIKPFLRFNIAIVSAADHLIWGPLKTYLSYEREKIDVPANREATDDGVLYTSANPVEFQVHRNLMARHARDTDLKVPRVSEGLENSRLLFVRMKEISETRNIDMSVLVIPSKQRVMTRWAKMNNITVSGLFDRAYANENAVIGRLLEMFSDLSIPAADVTDAMAGLVTRNLRDGKRTYPQEDPHPLEEGYAEYAKMAAELMSIEHFQD